MNDNVQRHKAICDELNVLYHKKNHDYGNSFHDTFLEEGMAMARIRLSDKLNRFKTLTRSVNPCTANCEFVRECLLELVKKVMSDMDSPEARMRIRDALVYLADKVSCDEDPQLVDDESIRDTLIDLANYAIMTVLELDAMKRINRANNATDDEEGSTVWEVSSFGESFEVMHNSQGYYVDSAQDGICGLCRHGDNYPSEYPCNVCRNHTGTKSKFTPRN